MTTPKSRTNSNYSAALRLYDRIATTSDSSTRERLQVQMNDLAKAAPEPKSLPKHVTVYPDHGDPDFVQKLLAKKEFGSLRTVSKSREEGVVACGASGSHNGDPEGSFRLTASQKFLRNLISPQTPYRGVLVFHGVGTGKTCAAVQIAESFRGVHTKRVLVLTPPSLKENFQRQIYDPSAGLAQCTGNSYKSKTASGAEGVHSHYQFMGYEVFANHIEKLQATLPPEALSKRLRERFSESVIIVDEVQNLRRVQNKYKGVSAALELVLATCTKVRLVMLTATPLFNDVLELVFIMEMLFLNDRNTEMLQRVRDPNFLLPGHTADPAADPVLAFFASRYVSYMRGENPHTFPMRLYPLEAVKSLKHKVDAFGRPKKPSGDTLLPLVVSSMTPRQKAAVADRLADGGDSDSEGEYDPSNADADAYTAEGGEDGGDGAGRLHQYYMQASNIVYPGEDGSAIVGAEGVRSCLRSSKARGGRTQYAYSDTALARDGPFLSPELLPAHAPKLAAVVEAACRAKGVVIVYSRFIASGLLPIALALEHRGFLPYSGPPLWAQQHATPQPRSQLSLGIPTDPFAPIPSMADMGPLGEVGVPDITRSYISARPSKSAPKLTGARFAVIAGDADLASSGGMDKLLAAINGPQNVAGDLVKVVLISSRAAEGFDFKHVRELHVVDPWFNLSRVEQIIGRGVRNCSHKLLPEKHRNCTIYLHACQYDKKREGIDMYMYHTSERKQRYISAIERVLKQHAMDCPLNEAQLHFRPDDFPEQTMEDSQGHKRTVQRGDQDFSRMCDFQKCDFKCATKVNLSGAREDGTTHTPFFDLPDVQSITRAVLALFQDNVALSVKDLERNFKSVRKDQLASALRGAIATRAPVTHKGVPGYIIYRSDKFLFQPEGIDDTKLTIGERRRIAQLMAAQQATARAQPPMTPERPRPTSAPPVGSAAVTPPAVPSAPPPRQPKAQELASSLESRAQLIADSVMQVLGEAANTDIAADMVVDGLNSGELAIVARQGAEPEFGQSLARGGYIMQDDGKDYLLDWHTMRYLDSKGEYISSYKSSEVLSKHRTSFTQGAPTPDASQRRGFIGSQGEDSVFKMVVPKEKQAEKLSGVVCARYPQLKKQELVQMIQELAPNSSAAGSQVKRGTACLVYEYVLRRSGGPQFVRPVAHVFSKPA